MVRETYTDAFCCFAWLLHGHRCSSAIRKRFPKVVKLVSFVCVCHFQCVVSVSLCAALSTILPLDTFEFLLLGLSFVSCPDISALVDWV